ncbi:MAG: hypothetical protein ACI3YT_10360 [Prevotella sp.]
MTKCLNFTAADNAKDGSLPYLEHYVGIVFKRGTSNGGEENTTDEYVKMIGNENLIKEGAFLNMLKAGLVKDARVVAYLNQNDWTKLEDGTASDLTGKDGTDVYLCHDNLYVINGGEDTVYEVYAVSSEPFSDEFGNVAKLCPMGGIPVDFGVVKDGKLRQIRDDSVLGTQSAVAVACDSIYGPDHRGGFPTTSMSRYAYEAAARALNDDANSNAPYMNETCFDIEFIVAWMYIEFRSKHINKYVGHGITSNQVPTSADWGKATGWKVTDDGVDKYFTLGTTVYKHGGTTKSGNMWQLMNGSCPLLKTFESQLSGNLEKVKNSDGEIISAPMTGIYTKTFSFVATFALTSTSEAKEYTVTVVLRNPVVRGKSNLFGQLLSWYSGYELTRTIDSENNQHHMVYRAKSIEDCVKDASDTNFDYESKYEQLGELPVVAYNAGIGYAKNSFIAKDGVNTALAKEQVTVGGMITNYDAAYYWNDSAAMPSGTTKQRKGSCFGSSALNGSVSLRAARVSSSPSLATADRGSAPRVALRSV